MSGAVLLDNENVVTSRIPPSLVVELKTEGEASSDDEHRAEVELQKLTDARVSDLDNVLKAKEKEILEV